ncbi:ABC transporter permease [Nitratireductor sp. StC3]|uniref:ABC transporter permease n=1 Tax=Nitratireductor sp. StC3 TaxID=2126741 RepID=UPI000D0C971F|nr:ABC transporter permease [Nitratireductor sp. StC3]PSM16793.1 ABC transporter permease [Nitratireductor sp. StC3]
MSGSLDTRTLVLTALAVAVAAAFGLAVPDTFLTLGNLQSMLLQASVIGILALAVAMSLMSGGIDLSINAVANLAAIVAALVMATLTPALGPLPAILAGLAAGLATGLACGALNGALIAFLGCPPILATLGTMMVFAGLGTVVTRGETFAGQPGWAAFGRLTVAGIPIAALIFVGLAVLLAGFVQRTVTGRRLVMVGANVKAARFSGVPVRSVLVRTYATSGTLASIAGLVSLSIANSVNVDFGSSYLLLAVLIAVLAGVSPEGGRGNILGVIAAVLLLQLLSTGLNMTYQSGSSNFLKEFAWGLALLTVLAVSRFDTAGWLKAKRSEEGGQ